MIDWNFVYDAMKSIHWLRNCNNLPEEFGKETLNKTIGEIWERTYMPKDRTHHLLNNAVLIMAAYIYFVYPKEKISQIDLTNISTDKFSIINYEKKHDKVMLINRLRNAIAHANYEIINNIITFTDFNSKNQKNNIIFSIGTVDFGEFIEQFRLEIYKQKILNKSKKD